MSIVAAKNNGKENKNKTSLCFFFTKFQTASAQLLLSDLQDNKIGKSAIVQYEDKEFMFYLFPFLLLQALHVNLALESSVRPPLLHASLWSTVNSSAAKC